MTTIDDTIEHVVRGHYSGDKLPVQLPHSVICIFDYHRNWLCLTEFRLIQFQLLLFSLLRSPQAAHASHRVHTRFRPASPNLLVRPCWKLNFRIIQRRRQPLQQWLPRMQLHWLIPWLVTWRRCVVTTMTVLHRPASALSWGPGVHQKRIHRRWSSICAQCRQRHHRFHQPLLRLFLAFRSSWRRRIHNLLESSNPWNFLLECHRYRHRRVTVTFCLQHPMLLRFQLRWWTSLT